MPEAVNIVQKTFKILNLLHSNMIGKEISHKKSLQIINSCQLFKDSKIDIKFISILIEIGIFRRALNKKYTFVGNPSLLDALNICERILIDNIKIEYITVEKKEIQAYTKERAISYLETLGHEILTTESAKKLLKFYLINEENAIKLLKDKKYKISKLVQQYKEI